MMESALIPSPVIKSSMGSELFSADNDTETDREETLVKA